MIELWKGYHTSLLHATMSLACALKYILHTLEFTIQHPTEAQVSTLIMYTLTTMSTMINH